MKISKIILYSILLGILLLIVKNVFNIEEGVLLSYYWKIALVVLVLIIIGNIAYFKYYANKHDKLLPLFNQGQYSQYIEQVESMLSKIKGETLKDHIKLNLAAAYMEERDHKKGQNILKEINQKNLRDDLPKMVYWLNTSVAHFRLNEKEEFNNIYNSKKPLIDKFKDNERYASNIAILDICNLILNEDLKEAKMLLDQALLKYTDDKNQKELKEISQILEARTKGDA